MMFFLAVLTNGNTQIKNIAYQTYHNKKSRSNQNTNKINVTVNFTIFIWLTVYSRSIYAAV